MSQSRARRSARSPRKAARRWDVRGATALVTGGGRRLGRAIVLALARAGANVVVNYHRSAADAERTALAAARFGVQAIALPADAGDTVSFDALLERAHAELGAIDILVANAGVFRRTPIESVTDDDWREMLHGNLDTFFVPARRLGPLMRERGRGCIIAVADVAGLRPWPAYAPYCAAKSAVVSLVRSLAVELAPHVRVNAVAPGPILFPADRDAAAYRREIARTLLQRPGEAANVADAVLFLARNDYVTGAVLPVDGGRLARS